MKQEYTKYDRHTQSHTANAKTAAQLFFEGMHAYAAAKPEQLSVLCRLSAAALLGILLGIFAFFFLEAAPISDPAQAAHDYITQRAFSSYASTRAYSEFLGAWFFHHAWRTALPLCTVICTCPHLLCPCIILLRGFLSGFAVCTLSGTFSVFAVYLTFAQTALCALCIYLGTKCTRYAVHRAKLQPQTKIHRTTRWFLLETAPTAAAVLITLTTLTFGLLLISCICTLLAR